MQARGSTIYSILMTRLGTNAHLIFFFMASDSSAFRLNVAVSHRSKEDKDTELVLLNFRLPDGSSHQKCFTLNHGVEYLKAYLAEQFGIAFEQISLFLGDELMIDPLSLSDYSVIVASSNGGKTMVDVIVKI